MGLLSEEKVEKLGSPLDTISNHLASTLSYGPSERDMILMRHDVSKIVHAIVPTDINKIIMVGPEVEKIARDLSVPLRAFGLRLRLRLVRLRLVRGCVRSPL